MNQQAFLVEGGWLDAIGYPKLSAMESIEQDWKQKSLVKSQAWTLQTMFSQWSMM